MKPVALFNRPQALLVSGIRFFVLELLRISPASGSERGFRDWWIESQLATARGADPIIIMKTPDYIVLGSGVAGLRAAIELARDGRVPVLTKDRLGESNPENTQGGGA